jgi:GNAT superfamily N-acetyltransferase
MPQIQLHAPAQPPPPLTDVCDVEVRIATPGDLRAVTRLFDAYRVFYGRSSNRRAARLFLADRMARGESAVLIARARPTASEYAVDVGFAQLYRSFSSVRLGPSLILNDLFVVPEARRQGVGARLVDACTAYARKARVVSLQLETHPENAAAMRLYADKGFVLDTEYARLSYPLELTVARKALR